MPIILDLPDEGPGSPPTGRTFLDLQNEVLAHGFSDSRYRERVKNWLNQGLYRIARSVKMSELEFETTIVTVAGTADYALPSPARIIALRDELVDETLQDITHGQYDALGEESGVARMYSLYGQRLHLFPVPNDARTLTLRYRSSAETMVEDGDIPSMPAEYSDLLVEYALAKAYAAEDDAQMAQFWRAEFDRDLGIMRSDVQFLNEGAVRQIPGNLRPATGLHFHRPPAV